MKTISGFIYRISNLYSSLACLLLLMAYAYFVVRNTGDCFDYNPTGYRTMPDLKFACSYTYLIGFLQNSSGASLQCFARFLSIWDNAFALVYGFTYLVWVSFLLKKTNKASIYISLLNLYPLALIGLDWLENFLELKILEHWWLNLSVEPGLASAAATVTVIKWCCSALNALFIGWLILKLFRKRFSKN